VARKTVGQRLEAARLDRGMSLNEVQQISKVQIRYLQAIENDDFDALPGLFYAKAFIRQYAQAVGEDGNKLVDLYEGKEVFEAPKSIVTEDEEWIEEKTKNKQVIEQRSSRHKRTLADHLPIVLLSLFALAILVVVAYMMVEHRPSTPLLNPSSSFSVDSLLESSTKEKESETSSSVTSSSTSSSTSTTTSSSKPEEKPEIALDSMEGNRLLMTAKNIKDPVKLVVATKPGVACWVQVLVNGQSIFMETIQGGMNQEIPISKDILATLPEGQRAFSFIAGAPANATITLNGVPVDISQVTNAAANVTIQLPDYII
jgi:cytoskeletal protein RodZ